MTFTEPIAGLQCHADFPRHAGSAIACSATAHSVATLSFNGSKPGLHLSLTSKKY